MKKTKWIQTETDLIWRLTVSSFKLRNEGSYLGIIWYLLNPLLMFSVLYIVFSTKLGANIEYYALYTLLGLIQWNFILLATGSSMSNIVMNAQLVKSLNFNRYSLIISSCLMALISHAFEIIVFLTFIVILGITPVLIFIFPLILVLQFMFALGISFALSSVTIFFRDLEHIWTFFSRIWWFVTPIFYSIDSSNGILFYINQINPMYYLVDISRSILIYNKLPELMSIIILCGFSIASLLIGYLVFSRLKNRFAEMV